MDKGLDTPKVEEIMERKVVAFQSDFSTFDVIRGFNQHSMGSAPVINESHEIVGFVSESDLINCIGNCLFYDESRNPTLESIMTKDVLAAKPDWDLFELEDFFISNHIRTAPVTDSENHLIGIVTRRDALRALESAMLSRRAYKKKIKTPVELNLHERLRMAIGSI